MKHVNLDRQDESVQRVIGAAACEEWTEAKNARRCDLIDKEVTGTLNAAEAEELAGLQREMLRHRHRVAPLPLEAARRLHKELLDGTQEPGS
jgi:hypothetical protein